ncbi:MAG: hypothetical protein IPF41_16970 [Flavobacteriales bacterium]|nr:hypothetical protein [Flavobacteriales bacterium]
MARINAAHGGSGTQFGNAAACPGGLFTFQQGGAALSGVVGASTNVGTWQPSQSPNLFHNGSNPNGGWTLRACDAVGADVGAVRFARVNLCTPPVAAFTAVDNCGSNQFSVQVNVTSYGTGTAANLAYTVDGCALHAEQPPTGHHHHRALREHRRGELHPHAQHQRLRQRAGHALLQLPHHHHLREHHHPRTATATTIRACSSSSPAIHFKR